MFNYLKTVHEKNMYDYLVIFQIYVIPKYLKKIQNGNKYLCDWHCNICSYVLKINLNKL